MELLCGAFRKGNVQVSVLRRDDSAGRLIDESVYPFIDDVIVGEVTIGEFFGELSSNVVYKAKGPIGLSYMYLELPESEGEDILCIGPYVSDKNYATNKISELAAKNEISEQKKKIFEEYVSNIPVINETHPYFVMLEVFCERLWGADAFSFVEKAMDRQNPMFALQASEGESEDGDVLVAMKIMEKRYEYENKLIKAVSLGQTQKAQLMLSGFSEYSFKKRISDPIRSVKNYCIIMNTLLRKAAENGGVHPMYIDTVSSAYAVKIETLANTPEAFEMMKDMISTYCRLVRKHSISSYSPLVQKAITMINADLSANLTLSMIAEAHNISSGYLATVFK
jgi:hypothetical protein